MSDKFNFEKNYDIDLKAVEEGVWTNLPSGIKVKLAHTDGGRFTQYIVSDRAFTDIQDAINKLDEEKDKDAILELRKESERELINIYANAVILDWDADEKYTPELAADMMMKYPIFFSEIYRAASSFLTFHKNNVKEDVEKVKKK